MIYGVITSRAHLNRLDPAARADGEIAWDLLADWMTDGSRPAFAGRYFLGHPNQLEADSGGTPGSGFCLWAHGEGADPDVPSRVIPLQRCDPSRQTAIGIAGIQYGQEDATALSGYLDRCISVGDIELPANSPVLVFLEIDDDLPISAEYWSAWASTLRDAVLSRERFTSRPGQGMVQPLEPAIRCAFKWDPESGTFLPDPKVQSCLTSTRRNGSRSRCYGFWARRFVGDPGLATNGFYWDSMGEFQQPVDLIFNPLPSIPSSMLCRVPVRYLQWFDGPNGLPIPPGELYDTLELLTLSYCASGADDPLPATLTATDWQADRTDVAGNLVERPVQFGIDKNRDLTKHAACLLAAQVGISSLPSSTSLDVGFLGTEFAQPIPAGPCSVAFRYYSSSTSRNKKDLRAVEARSLSAAGLHIGVTWETSFPRTATIDDLIDDFLTADRGRTNALAAFDCAAFLIGQPAYTPIYFAIDFPPGQIYIDGRLMPPMDDVLTYFKNVNQGYREYINRPGAVPYYIGAYAARYVCEALYRCGLATHFWQPWPPNWGEFAPERRDNWRPFRHANVWQVVLENTTPEPGRPNLVAENAALFACTSVDIDVAWGDPGTFQVF